MGILRNDGIPLNGKLARPPPVAPNFLGIRLAVTARPSEATHSAARALRHTERATGNLSGRRYFPSLWPVA